MSGKQDIDELILEMNNVKSKIKSAINDGITVIKKINNLGYVSKSKLASEADKINRMEEARLGSALWKIKSSKYGLNTVIDDAILVDNEFNKIISDVTDIFNKSKKNKK